MRRIPKLSELLRPSVRRLNEKSFIDSGSRFVFRQVELKLIWVLMVFLSGTVQESVYFQDLNTCLEFAQKVRSQNWHQSLAGDKVWVKAYCIPQKVDG